MSVKSFSRIGVVVATVAAAGVIASPAAHAGTVTISPTDAGPVSAGGAIKATAVIDEVDTPATLQIKLYTGSACTGGVLGSSQLYGDGEDANGNPDSDDVLLAGGGNYGFTVSNIDAGTYSWSATLMEGIEEGDAATHTDCSVAVSVGKASPSLTVGATNAAAGGKIQATGTLVNRAKPAPQNGDGTAPWTLRFDLYGPSDPTCSGTPVDTSTRPVYNSEHTYKSDTFTAAAAGTYRWKVTYSGDTNNQGVASNCGTPSSVVTSGGTPPPPPPPSSKWTCHGVTATFVGTNQAERIIGSPGNDVIVARGGNDIIDGRGGNDIICGGNGKDTIRGGTGNDVLRGGFGNDVLAGGQGNDKLYGEAGRDRLDGNAGDDALDGGSGKDTGRGGKGRDTVKSL